MYYAKPSLHTLLTDLSSPSFLQLVQNMVNLLFVCDVFSSWQQALPESLRVIAQNLTFHADASKQLFRTVII